MKHWKSFSFRETGLSHTANGTDCQDSVLIRETPQAIVAALADGLGSLRWSAAAAEAVTCTLCDLLLYRGNEIPPAAFGAGIVELLQKTVQERAAELKVSAENMDCTLAFVYISKTENRALVGRLGDSAVCLIEEHRGRVLSDSGKVANATAAILDKNAAEELKITTYDLKAEHIIGFILTSDGLDGEIYNKGSGHICKAAELYFNAVSMSQQPGGAIESRIRELTDYPDTPFDDDISLAVLSCTDHAVCFPEDPNWLCTCGERNPLQITYCCNCGKDFTVLYQNIRFSEVGGKDEYFLHLNQNPEEEARILNGASECTVTPADTGGGVVFSAPEAEFRKTAPPVSEEDMQPNMNHGESGRKPGKGPVIIAIAALLLIILLAVVLPGVLGKGETGEENVALASETQMQESDTEDSDQLLDQDVIMPAQEEVMPGQEEVVSGQGETMSGQNEVMPEQDEIMPDQEEAIPAQGESVPEQGEPAVDPMNQEETEENPDAENDVNSQDVIVPLPRAVVIVDDTNLRNGPGLDAEIVRLLDYGTVLYIQDENPVEADALAWVLVTFTDETTGEVYEGWISEALIDRVTE